MQFFDQIESRLPKKSQKHVWKECILVSIVKEVVEHDEKFSEVTFLSHTASDKQAKLLSSNAVCSWLVLHDFLPDQSHQRFRQLVKLHEGDTAIVTERKGGKWNGWAKGRVIASSPIGITDITTYNCDSFPPGERR